jgi:hypothetical protein
MRKTLAVVAAVLVFAGLAYTAAWLYEASQFEKAISGWKAEAEANGASISSEEIHIGGYPLALTAALRGLSIRNEARGVSFQIAPIQLQARPWNLHRITYDLSGRYALTLSRESPPALITMDIESDTGKTVFDSERRQDRSTASNVRIVTDKGIVTVSKVEISGFTSQKLTSKTDNTFHAEYDLAGLTASNRFGAELFQPPIEHMHLDADATGPFIDILKNGTVVDWARAGGAFTLHDASLQWNGLNLSLAGNGSLDAELRPSGNLTLTSTGFEEGLQSLEESGVIPPYLGEYIRQIAARFVTPAADGNKSRLLVAITAADGVLSVGGEPFAAIPSLKRL